MTRIVQIGFNRAGTSSIADFLRRAGFNVVDHKFETGPLAGGVVASLIEENMKSKRAPLSGLEAWTAFTDLEFVCDAQTVYAQFWFREIAEAHLDTKFILNIRRKADWLQSRAKFGGYLKTCAKAAGLTEAETVERWSKEWDEHIKNVVDYFTPERLLILDIDQPDEIALNRFVGSTRQLSLLQKNKTPRGPVSRFLSFWISPQFLTVFPQSFKNWLKSY